MNTRRQSDHTGAWFWRRGLRPLLGALFLLLLGLGNPAPASADLTVDGNNSSAASPYTIDATNSPFSGAIYVNSGGYLNIVDGAQISADTSAVVAIGGTVDISGGSISGGTAYGVIVYSGATVNISDSTISGGTYGVGIFGGTLSVSGGSISGGTYGVISAGGTANISGGTISGYNGVDVLDGGTVNISGGSFSGSGGWGVGTGGGTLSFSGGSISGGTYGVGFAGGALSINGCNLRLVGTQLIGTLQDGSLINTPTFQLGPQHLANQDTGALEIACPPNVTIQAPSGACSASLNPGTATASDGCSTPPVVGGVRSDGLPLTDPYPVGSTTITWTATNAAGSASCSQTVTVTGTQSTFYQDADGDGYGNPALTTQDCTQPTGYVTNNQDCDDNNAAVHPGALEVPYDGIDNDCSGTDLTDVDGDTYPGGPSGTDCNDNQAGIHPGATEIPNDGIDQDCNGADLQQPIITCPSNITRNSDPGKCMTTVNPGTATATGGSGAVQVNGSRSDGQPLTAPYPTGTTTITWSATDAAGNSATCTQTVIVPDTQAPRINCPGDKRAKPGSGNTASVNPGTATATDNCRGASVSGTRSDGLALTAPYPLGTTTITWLAVDASGNSATCTQKVIVK